MQVRLVEHPVNNSIETTVKLHRCNRCILPPKMKSHHRIASHVLRYLTELLTKSQGRLFSNSTQGQLCLQQIAARASWKEKNNFLDAFRSADFVNVAIPVDSANAITQWLILPIEIFLFRRYNCKYTSRKMMWLQIYTRGPTLLNCTYLCRHLYDWFLQMTASVEYDLSHGSRFVSRRNR